MLGEIAVEGGGGENAAASGETGREMQQQQNAGATRPQDNVGGAGQGAPEEDRAVYDPSVASSSADPVVGVAHEGGVSEGGGGAALQDSSDEYYTVDDVNTPRNSWASPLYRVQLLQYRAGITRRRKAQLGRLHWAGGVLIGIGLIGAGWGIFLMRQGMDKSREESVWRHREVTDDFVKHPQPCRVRAVEHCWGDAEKYGRSINTDCLHTFVYTFDSGALKGLQSEVYEGKDQDTVCGKGCATHTVVLPAEGAGDATAFALHSKFEMGEEVTCWRPVSGRALSPLYNCPNEPCIKLSDPQEDLEGPGSGGGAGQTFAGASLLGVCSICMCLMWACCLRSLDRPLNKVLNDERELHAQTVALGREIRLSITEGRRSVSPNGRQGGSAERSSETQGVAAEGMQSVSAEMHEERPGSRGQHRNADASVQSAEEGHIPRRDAVPVERPGAQVVGLSAGVVLGVSEEDGQDTQQPGQPRVP